MTTTPISNSQHDKIIETALKFQYPDTPTSLLPSNYTPGLVDRTIIQDQLAACDSIIESLVKEYRHDDAVVNAAEMESLIAAYRKYQDFQRYLISPVRRIPNEILVLIFGYVHGRYSEYLHIFGTESNDFWNVLFVCVRWRNVAQSIPSFWSKFRLDHFELDKPSSGGNFPLDIDSFQSPSDNNSLPGTICRCRILKCLKNSRKAPMNIAVLPPSNPDVVIFGGILLDITKQCFRWEVLEISSGIIDLYSTKFTNDSFRDVFEWLVDAQGLPKLRKLVYNGTEHRAHPQWAAVGFFRYFHSTILEEFTIRDVDNFPYCGNDEFPWPNLRKIVFSGCRYDYNGLSIFGNTQGDYALQKMVLLEELVVDNCSSCYNYDGQPEIILPGLHTLHPGLQGSSYYMYESRAYHFLFPPISIPNLTTLKISGNTLHDSTVEKLLATIHNSGSNVKYLELGVEPESVDRVVEILEGLHQVEELELVQAQEYVDNLLRNMVSTQNLLPCLTKLVVWPEDVYMDSDIDLALILFNFIQSRDNSSLTQVTVSISSVNQIRFKDSIQKLRDLGGEIEIKVETTLVSYE